MVVFLWWCFWGGVFGVVSCGGVFVVVFLSLCLCGGVFVVVFLRWCFCAGVFVVVFLWWCFCGGVFVVVFLWWCFCGGVFVVVFLWCGCGGVLVVVFLWRCFCGGVLVVVYKVLFQYYKVLLQYYNVLLRTTKYYSVLQSTTPVLLRTTKYYSSTTKYYSAQQSNTPVLLRTTKVLLQYYSVLQSTTPTSETTSERRPSSILLRTTPVLQKLPKRAFRAMLPPQFSQNELPKRAFPAMLPTIFTEKASKRIVSCEASSKFHRSSFQNERFVRGFLQISQNHASKTSVSHDASDNFARKKASKMIVSCEASSKFHRTSFQNERFVRGFLQISQNHAFPKRAFRTKLPTILQEKASKMIVSCEASSKFHRTSFQNERFARCFRQFSRKFCVSLQFRTIDTPLPARGFIRQKQNVPRTTTPCIPKFHNVRFATAACTKMYESIHREPTRFAHTKM